MERKITKVTDSSGKDSKEDRSTSKRDTDDSQPLKQQEDTNTMCPTTNDTKDRTHSFIDDDDDDGKIFNCIYIIMRYKSNQHIH